ncbi:MAG TPA: V-type ATP synthase subunit D [Candidatus Dormibacteraeota bacterium]|nr:V-type ATP synthase subunit D [Candidatus Dormibacteraeota bacterium]
MKIHHPVGRSGALWLRDRRQLATKGRDLLAQKRMVLSLERERLAAVAERAQADWRRAYASLDVWMTRAMVLGGPEQVFHVPVRPARVTIRERSAFGVTYPSDIQVAAEPAATLAGGGSSALDIAAEHSVTAVRAGVELAAAQTALRRLENELRSTTRRVRAIERRWMPALIKAQAGLELQLEEKEREELVRAAWARTQIEGHR